MTAIRSPEQAYEAGARAAAADPPLTETQVTGVALLVAQYRAPARTEAA